MFVEPGIGKSCVCLCVSVCVYVGCFMFAKGGFGCSNCMDFLLLLVDYSKAPPEGTGHNGGGIQGETKPLFY